MVRHRIFSSLALVILLCLSATVVILPEGSRAQVTYPTVSLLVHRIQKVDTVEGLPGEGGADWYYYVGFNDEGNWDWQYSGDLPDNVDDLTVDHQYDSQTTHQSVSIAILLCEADFWTSDDMADVSSDPGGGADNVDCSPPGSGTYEGTYIGTWNLVTSTLSGDTTYQEAGYYKTSGDYDGSTGYDENDANVWFDIWDNYDSPMADAGPGRSGYIGQTISLDGSASSASPGSSIVEYKWDFDNDGVFDDVGEITSTTFSSKGEHVVSLRVTDSIGVSDDDTTTVTILNMDPVAAFTYSPEFPSTQTNIQFTDTSTDPDGTIASWSWDFGDGSTTTERFPSHTYEDDGTYTVTLTVTDDDGGTDVESKVMTVSNTPPVAAFSFSPVNPKVTDTVKFTDSSTDPDGAMVAWNWDFGDGYFSTDKDASHKFSDPGTYTVRLTVTDDDGDANSISLDVTISESEALDLFGGDSILPWILIILLIVVVVAVAILLLSRRKRSKQ